MERQHIKIVFGGILFLVVAMGISRFAFTPILPFMREDEGFSLQIGGWLASSNYIGYFLGSLGAAFIYKRKKAFLMTNVALNVLSIIVMGLTHSLTLWLLLRFIAGLTGGFIFVLTSSIVMDYLAAHILTRWSGLVFSGIGLGIAISGLVVPYLESIIAWDGTWIGLGFLSALLATTSAILWRNLMVHNNEKIAKSNDTDIWRGFMPWLIIAYGLEGLGYIITGTFLVDIIYNIESLRAYAGYSWVVAGLAAVPSAPLWVSLMSKLSPVKAMAIAYLLQIIGIILPVLSQTAWSVLLSAFLFGMTFVGLVSMSTGYARQLFPTQSGTVVSVLTTFYAFGQIIGPILASKFEAHYNSYKAPLLFAGAVVTLALIILLIGRWYSIRKTILKKAA
ncbi:YbfB/YjiJ family MFS transporter [Bacillus ndiopicus]|uniref:YbfB/YjiJ family MFS transporter n=1 Tax=Bacillus ndiopicus TaxID=1347368 RepID=UPI0005AA81F9|nr:YbfB/YjiJ family MFS transporter [Bacillus ndiopicus]